MSLHATDIGIIRRSLLCLIIIVLGAVAISFLGTSSSTARVARRSYRMLNPDLVRSVDHLEYSEHENGVVRFVLRAEQLSETRYGSTLLRGIEVLGFRPDGNPLSSIRSMQAELDRKRRTAFFSGGVEIRMDPGVEIRTNALVHDLRSNVGDTDDWIELASKRARGMAKGARYDNASGGIELKGDVRLHLEPSSFHGEGIQHREGWVARSRKGFLSPGSRVIRLNGGARLESGSAHLLGDMIEITFSKDGERMVVEGNAQMEVQRRGRSAVGTLNAREIYATFRDPEDRGALRPLDAVRGARWESLTQVAGPAAPFRPEQRLGSDSLGMVCTETEGLLDSPTAADDVSMEGISPGDSQDIGIQHLGADEVRLRFSPGNNQLSAFEANGHVELLYSRMIGAEVDKELQEFRTSSDNLRATFRHSDGRVETISQWGDFTYQDGSVIAKSGRGHYDAARDALVLCESPEISNSNGLTTGDRLTYERNSKVLSVKGQVRTVFDPQTLGGLTGLVPDSGSVPPTLITADDLRFWTDSSRLRYTGNVRMISENGQLRAHVLEVLDSGRRLEAEGEIRHILPGSKESSVAGTPEQTRSAVGSRKLPEGIGTNPIVITSRNLRVTKSEKSALYFGDVSLQAEDLFISADSMVAFFESEGQQIKSATARGKVWVRQAGREVTGRVAVYSPTTGRVVVMEDSAGIKSSDGDRPPVPGQKLRANDDQILLQQH